MTKEQFLKTYGQPNTVVSFKNDAEKMEFLNECEKFDIIPSSKTKECIMICQCCVNISDGTIRYSSIEWYEGCGYSIILYAQLTPSPKSLIKNGWMGVQRNGIKVHFLPSVDSVVLESSIFCFSSCYEDDLKLYKRFTNLGRTDVMELYDNLGNLQWKREEKSTKDIEIERIQAEMNKLADDLSKLKDA